MSVPLRQEAGSREAVLSLDLVGNVIRITRFDRVSPRGDHLREVIRMNGVVGSPALQLFESFAEVFQDLVVDEFDLTCRGHDGYQAGNAIDDQPNTLFALAWSHIAITKSKLRSETS